MRNLSSEKVRLLFECGFYSSAASNQVRLLYTTLRYVPSDGHLDTPRPLRITAYVERPSRPIHLNVHIEFNPGMVGKGVLLCYMTSLCKLSIDYILNPLDL